MRRLFCAIGLVVGCYTPATAIGPDDPAATYYETCIVPSVPVDGCDELINNALMGIIVGQFDQKRPSFCYPQKLVEEMQSASNKRGKHPRRLSEKAPNSAHPAPAEMRTAVARYMRDHPERLSDKTLQVIFTALLNAFPCPG